MVQKLADILKHVVSFYKFFCVADPAQWATDLHAALHRLHVVGTVLIAREGVNATLVHENRLTLDRAVQAIEEHDGCGLLKTKYSTAHPDNPVFHRLKIKLRDEIIQFGKTLRVSDPTGKHVSAQEWNELLCDPEVLTLDVRNDYERMTGAFKGSVPIGMSRFGEFEQQIDALLASQNNQAIAMYCTGGIRCEKASNALLERGVEHVYQLDGGILRYLENVHPNESKWEGECFVFDQRVSVDTNLMQGHFDQCHACRRPIDEKDKQSPHYVKSVSCHYCVDETSVRQKEQFAERAKQQALAEARGVRHVGAPRG